VGAEQLTRGSSIGFGAFEDEAKTAEEEYQKMKDKVLDLLKRAFRPEFLNRVDGIMVFRPLTRAQIKQIVDIMMRQVNERLRDKEIELELTEAAKTLLAEEGYDPKFGARPLRRVIQHRIEDRVSEGFLSGEFGHGNHILVDAQERELTFTVVEHKKDHAAEGEPVGAVS